MNISYSSSHYENNIRIGNLHIRRINEGGKYCCCTYYCNKYFNCFSYINTKYDSHMILSLCKYKTIISVCIDKPKNICTKIFNNIIGYNSTVTLNKRIYNKPISIIINLDKSKIIKYIMNNVKSINYIYLCLFLRKYFLYYNCFIINKLLHNSYWRMYEYKKIYKLINYKIIIFICFDN
jgi:hypothetical protein